MTTSPTPIIVFGATGRTGSRVCAIALERAEFRLLACVGRGVRSADAPAARAQSGPESPLFCDDPAQLAPLKGHARAVIDFTSDEGARAACRAALELGCALVVGTTALSDVTRGSIDGAARSIPVLVAPNMSLGVAVLARLAGDAVRALGPGYEASIVEAHHSRKKDAPSGTALRLSEAIRRAGAVLRDDQILALRGGDVIGEHTIRLAGPGEYIELTHRATSRDLFALGALHAAAWLADQTPGSFTIEDMLGAR